MSSRYKKGQSGNPKGRPKKPKPDQIDGKALFKKMLGKKMAITSGGLTQTVTVWEAGLMQLGNQFAKGDAKARRDVFWAIDKYGIKLFDGREGDVGKLLPPDHYRKVLEEYVKRASGPQDRSSDDPKIAPPDLLDDDKPDGDAS
jgi:hypothetical protein